MKKVYDKGGDGRSYGELGYEDLDLSLGQQRKSPDLSGG
jgi:hypothetical protein